MLFHARNVSAFLLSKRPKVVSPNKTDVVANHYFDAGWANRPAYLIGSNRQEHDELMAEINRRMAHITTYGLWGPTGAIKPFHWSEVVVWLPKVLIGFGTFMGDLKAVHPKRAEWFSRVLRTARNA